VIALPPSSLGAVQLTNAWPFPALADTFCGAVGAVAPVGVTAFDGDDAGPGPAELDACTTNVYEAPAVSPVTVVLVTGGDPVTVVGVCPLEPTYGVIVYVDTAPPVDGADHETAADIDLAVAVTFVTCPGGAGGAACANMTSTQ
jgi:hypothetical protein